MADAPKQNPAAQVATQLKQLWEKQPKGRRTLAVVAVVGIAGFVGITTILHKTETWIPVADMSPEAAQQVYSKLINRGLTAKFEAGKVLVQDTDIDQARAISATTIGMSSMATMDSKFKDGGSLGRTSFDEQVAYKIALQGELGRSIMDLSHVQSANVQIAFGKKTAISAMETPATASVTLVPAPGQKLTPDQVSGIRSLVAASVENLDATKVAVIGPNGQMDGNEKNSSSKVEDLEQKIANKVRSHLETLVGMGHVIVNVAADIDERKVDQVEDIYDKDSAVPRSTSETIDGNDPTKTGTQSSVGGIAGAQGNLPGAPAPTGGAANANAAAGGHVQRTINNEINHIVKKTAMPDQSIKKLHVAVLVDQLRDKDGKAIAVKPEDSKMWLAQARLAAGIDDARGDQIELSQAPFAAPPEMPPLPVVKPLLPVPMPVAAGGAGGLVVLIAAVLFMLKRKKAKKAANENAKSLVLKGNKLALPPTVATLERVLDGDTGAASLKPELPGKETLGLPEGKSVQDRVMDVVRSDVERAASVLTGWLAEAPQPSAKQASK
ncbi:MAG: flagellar basal-body MS-ring/collar protein FliF [Kofleriaceae bacterium]